MKRPVQGTLDIYPFSSRFTNTIFLGLACLPGMLGRKWDFASGKGSRAGMRVRRKI
jgi:hypothetical protein